MHRHFSVLLIVLGTGVLFACPTPPAAPKLPTVGSFTASPDTVAKGGQVTLAWSVTDSTTVTIVNAASMEAVPGVDGKADGQATVTINDPSVFLLTATNSAQQKVTATAAVSVQGTPASITFTAVPAEVGPTEPATLVWSAQGAKSVSIVPMGGAALNLGMQVEAGSVQVNPTGVETVYTLTADGATRTATVKRRPAIGMFELSRSSGTTGDMVTVSWQTTNATSVTLTATGRAMPLTTVSAGAMVAMGTYADTLVAAPAGSVITYQLEARGPGGASTQTAQLVFGDGPRIVSFSAPLFATPDSGVALRWSAINADVAELGTDGGPRLFTSTTLAEVTDGGLRLATPSAPTEYVLTARNTITGQVVREARIVTPIGAVATPTFTANPMTAVMPGTPVTLTWSAPNARRARVLENGELTVGYVEGVAAEMGTATVYPNQATTTYTLRVDNTVDAPVVATLSASAVPALQLGAVDGGPIFDTATNVDLGWSLGAPNAQLVGYPHADIVAGGAFDDIAMTGTPVVFPSTNDAVQYVDLRGFETFLYGARMPERIGVSTNGWLKFTTGTISATATPATGFPGGASSTYDNVIAPFWADLDLGGTGQVLWQIKGAAPKRTLIVQFQGVKVASQMTSTLTFQVQVSQAGQVRVAYGTMTFTPPTTAPVFGLQGTAGLGLAMTYGGSNTAVTFFGPKPSPLSVTAASALPQRGFLEVGMGLMRVSTITPIRAADLRISEVMYNPAPALTAGQWFEVFNASASPFDVSGWTIDFGGSTHTIAPGTVLAPSAFHVFGQADAGPDNDDVVTHYVYGGGFSMPTTAGTITLTGPGIAARARWGATDAGADAGGTVLVGSADAGVAGLFDPTPYILASDPSGTQPGGRACFARRPFGTQAPQQLGSPGTSESCFGVLMTAIPSRFTDISGTGTKVTFTSQDDDYATVMATGAPINLGGDGGVTSFGVSTNGFLAPTVTSSGSFNETRPNSSSPNGGLAVYWDDLVIPTSGAAGVYTKRFAAGEDPQSPGAHWVIQWTNMLQYSFGASNGDLTFQAKVFDDGTIEYHYGTMSWATTGVNGSAATVWLENATGTFAVAPNVNQGRVVGNSAYRFTRQ